MELRVEIAGVDPFEVTSMRGRERLSTCFQIDLTVAAPDDADLAALLGRTARFILDRPPEPRIFAGVIARVQRGETIDRGRRIGKLRLVPRLWQLGLNRASRVFQSLTTVEIAERLFRASGIGLRKDLSLPLAEREICIQHDESDLAFVERLFAEDGLTHHVQSDVTGQEIVSVFDTAGAYVDMPGDPRLHFRPRPQGGNGLAVEENHVARFVEEIREATRVVVMTAYDFKRPRDLHVASDAARELAPMSDADPRAAIHEHHGPYGEMQTTPQSPAILLDQARRSGRQFKGASECPRLAVGRAFALDEHRDTALNGDYAITEVRHRAHPAAANRPTYENTFRAVRRSFLERPARPPRRVRQSLETATVVGIGTDEIHTDTLGRIKVRFHWDREDSAADAASCWIRVAAAWSGVAYGAQFVPRAGMEVLVAFLGGDPDRPVVTGCLPNATHPPPFSLPASKTRSGWKTRSTPDPHGAGYHELSFEDAIGQEEIRVHSARDINVRVERDHATEAGADWKLQTGGNHSIAVAGASSTRVDGSGSVTYGGSGSLAVGGALTERITGHRDVRVSGGSDTTVAGIARTHVQGDRRDEVTGVWSSEATSRYTLSVGSSEHPGQSEVQVRGLSIHRTEGSAVIEARDALTLICGASRIELTPETITLRGPTLRIAASKSLTVEGDGPAITLTDRAEISADALKLRGKEASLDLGSKAELKGTAISMSKGEPLSPEEGPSTDPKKQRVSVKFLDDLGKPYGDKRYELRAGGATFAGKTNGEGLVAHDVEKEAKVAIVDLWIADYPQGPRRSYTLTIDAIPDASTRPGAKARLHHLGYYRGPLEDEEDSPPNPELIAAVWAFQRDLGLDPTGLLDAKTISAIAERHGH